MGSSSEADAAALEEDSGLRVPGAALPPLDEDDAVTSKCIWCRGDPARSARVCRHVEVGNVMPENIPSMRNGCAGVVAFREPSDSPAAGEAGIASALEVLVVNKRDRKLGFPKGGAEGEEDPRSGALREYVEETSLPAEALSILEGVVLVDIWRCHYYVANSTVPDKEPEAGTPGCKRGWKPVAEDPTDRNPVVFVQWKSVNDTLQDDMMSGARKKLLRAALGLRNEQRQAAQPLQARLRNRDEQKQASDIPRPKNMADIDALFKLGRTVNVENAEATEAATPVHDEQD